MAIFGTAREDGVNCVGQKLLAQVDLRFGKLSLYAFQDLKQNRRVKRTVEGNGDPSLVSRCKMPGQTPQIVGLAQQAFGFLIDASAVVGQLQPVTAAVDDTDAELKLQLLQRLAYRGLCLVQRFAGGLHQAEFHDSLQNGQLVECHAEFRFKLHKNDLNLIQQKTKYRLCKRSLECRYLNETDVWRLDMSNASPTAKMKPVGLWVLIGLAALVFAAAGGAKLTGVEMMHQSFAKMGLPPAFGYMIGLFEVLVAIGLLIRRLSAAAAAGLAVIMIGAIGYHLAFDPVSAAIPAVVLFAICATVAVARKPDLRLL